MWFQVLATCPHRMLGNVCSVSALYSFRLWFRQQKGFIDINKTMTTNYFCTVKVSSGWFCSVRSETLKQPDNDNSTHLLLPADTAWILVILLWEWIAGENLAFRQNANQEKLCLWLEALYGRNHCSLLERSCCASYLSVILKKGIGAEHKTNTSWCS